MKINILTTCYNRRQYLENCLSYIDKAISDMKSLEINIYVAHNISNQTNMHLFKGLNVEYITIPHENIFRKGFYLNSLLKLMRKDFDWLLQWDSDLIMNPYFWSEILSNDNIDPVCFFLGGVKLKKEVTETLQNNKMPYHLVSTSHFEFKSLDENKKQFYVGNWAMNQKCYSLITRILNSDMIYDDNFAGWGGEDSVISFLIKEMEAYKLVFRDYILDCWHHMWHERECNKSDSNKQQYTKNVILMQRLIVRNKDLIQKYIRENVIIED